MGYQALLFCADEKTARTLTQVLSELEFSVEPCTETFAAVKKLMGGHFDAVVVDCDNEQNATLLFKSARNSTSNQASLAVAVVEGQAGVAKAFRIGANLVLTKPINVEQAKGTLRVARGLLRKGEAAKPAAPVATTPTPPTQRPAAPPAKPAPTPTPTIAARPSAAPVANPATSVNADAPVPTSSPVPTMAPPAARKVAAIAPPTPQMRPTAPLAAPAHSIPAVSVEARPLPRPAAPLAPTVSAPAASGSPSASFGGGAASAAAPAREAQSPAAMEAAIPSIIENDALSSSAPSATAEPSESLASMPAPTFTFGGANVPEASGGKKKILVGVAAVVLVGALLYAGQSFLGGHAAPPVSQPVVSSKPAVLPAPAPSAPAAAETSKASAGVTPNTSTQPPSASASPAGASSTSPTANQFQIEPVPSENASAAPAPVKENSPTSKPAAAAQPADAPRVVKGGAVPKVKSQPAAPDTPAPSVIGMDTSASSGPLPNLVDSSAEQKPVLQRLNISQGVSQGLLIKKVEPVYPPTAVRMQVEGPVQMLATVSKTGDITDLKILSGNPQLTRAAADAVKRWKYKPYLLNGEPVEIQTQITVNFRLPH
jgi:protein TonB